MQMEEILGHYCDPGALPRVEPLGAGHINDTWLVRTGEVSFVLQRLNCRVFPHPQRIVDNLAILSSHVAGKKTPPGRRWEHCTLLPTRAGALFCTDGRGELWRAVRYIDNTVTLEAVTSPTEAGEVGWALGHFHRLVTDLPGAHLHDTLPGFHVLPRYLSHFDRVRERGASSDRGGETLDGHRLPQGLYKDSDLRFCLDFVEARRSDAAILEQARQQGKIRVRTIHGDPKAGNVLFDAASGQAVSLIDLDTVGPGLILSDIGDCLRSCCNPSGETTADLSRVVFDLDFCRELLAGYFAGAGEAFPEEERGLIFQAARLTAFELGLRFLTDFLEGNRYFKVSCAEENLHRARVQFHLTRSMERQQREIEALAVKGGCPSRR